MATVLAPSSPATFSAGLPGRRYDHYFFSAMALLMLATVFVGFGPTYYMAGVFRAPLPNWIIHVHGAAFSCWILLLITQTSLVSAGRVDIHRKLGIAGFLLAAAMVVLGVMAAVDSLVREGGPPGRDAKAFFAIPLSTIIVFGILIFFAYRNRSNPMAHKRLVMLATTSLLVAALARWGIIHRRVPIAMRSSYVFLLLLLIYDLWSTRKVHPATLWAGAFLIFVQQMAFPIGHSAWWHAFAGWVQATAR